MTAALLSHSLGAFEIALPDGATVAARHEAFLSVHPVGSLGRGVDAVRALLPCYSAQRINACALVLDARDPLVVQADLLPRRTLVRSARTPDAFRRVIQRCPEGSIPYEVRTFDGPRWGTVRPEVPS